MKGLELTCAGLYDLKFRVWSVPYTLNPEPSGFGMWGLVRGLVSTVWRSGLEVWGSRVCGEGGVCWGLGVGFWKGF